MNILLVDDNCKSRKAVGQVLSYLGHRITQCADGWEAYHLLEQAKYDLVITDYDMPRMNGLELLQRMHSLEINQQTEVVMVTANPLSSIRDQAYLDGVFAYLLKPINLDQLIQILNSINQSITEK